MWVSRDFSTDPGAHRRANIRDFGVDRNLLSVRRPTVTYVLPSPFITRKSIIRYIYSRARRQPSYPNEYHTPSPRTSERYYTHARNDFTDDDNCTRDFNNNIKYFLSCRCRWSAGVYFAQRDVFEYIYDCILTDIPFPIPRSYMIYKVLCYCEQYSGNTVDKRDRACRIIMQRNYVITMRVTTSVPIF